MTASRWNRSVRCGLQYDDDIPNELMVEYSINYEGKVTNEYVFFIRPEPEK